MTEREELELLRAHILKSGVGMPWHNHRCPEGHEWPCTSPYCAAISRLCTEHGGEEPRA